jgi:hypothetical protein
MVERVDAMSMADPQRSQEEWHLLRRLFLLLLVVTATALGLVLLAKQNRNVPLVLFNVLADTSLGLLAGFATRLALKDRHGLIQALAASAFSLVGLGVLGYFSGWRAGIGPLQPDWVSVHWLDGLHIPLRLPLEFRGGAANLLDLVNAVIAIDTSWMALRVWKQSVRVSGQPSTPRRVPRSRQSVQSHEEPIEPVAVTPAVVPPAAPARKRPATSSGSSGAPARARIRRKAERAVVAKPTADVRPVRSKPRRNTSRRIRPTVHLAVHEEHKCPYCFQPVSRNDPRGVVECPISHTLHHKDCWDVTGNCQVPHLTTL